MPGGGRAWDAAQMTGCGISGSAQPAAGVPRGVDRRQSPHPRGATHPLRLPPRAHCLPHALTGTASASPHVLTAAASASPIRLPTSVSEQPSPSRLAAPPALQAAPPPPGSLPGLQPCPYGQLALGARSPAVSSRAGVRSCRLLSEWERVRKQDAGADPEVLSSSTGFGS